MFSNGSQDRFTIQANSDENHLRVDSIKVDGDCAWEIESNEGDFLQTRNDIEIPTDFYIYEIAIIYQKDPYEGPSGFIEGLFKQQVPLKIKRECEEWKKEEMYQVH